MSENILEVVDLHVYIGSSHILQGLSFEVIKGGVTALLGRNGAGKSTTLRSIISLVSARSGKIIFCGKEIQNLPPYNIKKVSYVPEDRGIFSTLTVEENFRVASRYKGDKLQESLETVFSLFPDLKKFWKNSAGSLSGGQKQMLAIGRALANDVDLMLVDEPSKALAPIIVEKMIESLAEISKNTTILLVEQNLFFAESLSHSCIIVDDGTAVFSGPMKQIASDKGLREQYLGVGY